MTKMLLILTLSAALMPTYGHCQSSTGLLPFTVADQPTKAEKELYAKAMAERASEVAHNKALVIAMTSRLASDIEMAEFVEIGVGVFGEPFSPCGAVSSCGFSGDIHEMQDAHELYLSRKFNDVLAQQFKLRAIAAEHKKEPEVNYAPPGGYCPADGKPCLPVSMLGTSNCPTRYGNKDGSCPRATP